MRKHVTPAHPRATIHDPERGRKLPPEGASVAWTAYWARLAEREDVIVSEVAEAAPQSDGPQGEPEPDAHG